MCAAGLERRSIGDPLFVSGIARTSLPKTARCDLPTVVKFFSVFAQVTKSKKDLRAGNLLVFIQPKSSFRFSLKQRN
jgi:hypothetical protein